MPNFVLLYTGGSMPEDEAEVKEVMDAWGAWYGKLGESIVDGGNPFSASKGIKSDGTVIDSAVSEPEVTGYTIISADSLDDAVDMSKDHPHLKYGGSVSVHETMQM